MALRFIFSLILFYNNLLKTGDDKLRYLVVFIVLFLHWIIWSGMFDAFHLTLGVIACGIVTVISGRMMFQRDDFSSLPKEIVRFIRYFFWLLYQTYLSNIHVLKIVFSPNIYDRLNPRIIKFKAKLKKESSLVTFANSITLTPGTVTIVIKDGIYYVHAIDEEVASGLPGEMENRCGYIFSDGNDNG